MFQKAAQPFFFSKNKYKKNENIFASQREEIFSIFYQSTKREKKHFSWSSFNKGNKKDHFSKKIHFGLKKIRRKKKEQQQQQTMNKKEN